MVLRTYLIQPVVQNESDIPNETDITNGSDITCESDITSESYITSESDITNQSDIPNESDTTENRHVACHSPVNGGVRGAWRLAMENALSRRRAGISVSSNRSPTVRRGSPLILVTFRVKIKRRCRLMGDESFRPLKSTVVFRYCGTLDVAALLIRRLGLLMGGSVAASDGCSLLKLFNN